MLLRPIKGELAMKFWSSANVCNRVKAICAYSTDKEDANMNLARYGFTNSFRKRVINSKGVMFNNPLMTGIPYNPGNTPIWVCLERTPDIPGNMTNWNDQAVWHDNTRWVENSNQGQPIWTDNHIWHDDVIW